MIVKQEFGRLFCYLSLEWSVPYLIYCSFVNHHCSEIARCGDIFVTMFWENIFHKKWFRGAAWNFRLYTTENFLECAYTLWKASGEKPGSKIQERHRASQRNWIQEQHRISFSAITGSQKFLLAVVWWRIRSTGARRNHIHLYFEGTMNRDEVDRTSGKSSHWSVTNRETSSTVILQSTAGLLFI